MKRDEILAKLAAKFPQVVFRLSQENSDGVYLPSGIIPQVAEFLKNDPELAFDLMNYMTAIDYISEFELVYHFSSLLAKHHLVLKTQVDRKSPQVPTLALIYPTADWFEREVYDLFGVEFTDHPDLTRIMMPDDWAGHPMRKDYAHENLIPLPTGSGPVIADHTGHKAD